MRPVNRRKFIEKSIKASLSTVGASVLLNHYALAEINFNEFQFTQLKLPYGYNDLEKSIDAMTMEIHYKKHHAAYVLNVNDAIRDEKITATSEQEFFKMISKKSSKARNNGGGAFNHNLFWEVMSPVSTGIPSGKIADAINGAFGSFEKMKELFTQSALTRFGSGWAWLVKENGKLKIGSTPNQDNPLMDISEFKGTPLLALDVWEHAYYLRYQNKRNEYVANWWNVVNWEAVAGRL